MKHDAFVKKLASILDAYIRSVRHANAELAGKGEPPLLFTFENFIKWFTYVYRDGGKPR